MISQEFMRSAALSSGEDDRRPGTPQNNGFCSENRGQRLALSLPSAEAGDSPMGTRHLLTVFALATLVAAPAIAQEAQRRRPRVEGQARPEAQAEAQPERPVARERAVPRTVEPQRRDDQNQRAEQNRRDEQNRREQQARRDDQIRRENEVRRQNDDRRNDNGRYDNNRRYDNGRYDNGRRQHRRNDSRRYTPRIVRPVIVRVAPYRPYVYRPSYSRGVYYGSNGYYPYGYTPRGYFEPIPGRYYGGVRITGMPRDARVFADGYYVGIVNDFDGIFQHMNLEAGSHHIEIEMGGNDGIEFDVYVRPGETTTFRGDGYFGRY